MLRLNGYYLYELGHRLHSVADINVFPGEGAHLHTRAEVLGIVFVAQFALKEFVTASVYNLRSIRQAANELNEHLESVIGHCSGTDNSDKLPSTDIVFQLQEKHREFEAVLKAELQSANIFLVQQKAAFDTLTLTESGHLAFPPDTLAFVPEVEGDLNASMRCIAFDLPTAAAFHLHRALETVLGYYWDEVSGGEDRPNNQTLGSYLQRLEKLDDVNEYLVPSLRDIKNLHRNPTIHADQSLQTVEAAIDLQGAIRAAISIMLRDMES